MDKWIIIAFISCATISCQKSPPKDPPKDPLNQIPQIEKISIPILEEPIDPILIADMKAMEYILIRCAADLELISNKLYLLAKHRRLYNRSKATFDQIELRCAEMRKNGDVRVRKLQDALDEGMKNLTMLEQEIWTTNNDIVKSIDVYVQELEQIKIIHIQSYLHEAIRTLRKFQKELDTDHYEIKRTMLLPLHDLDKIIKKDVGTTSTLTLTSRIAPMTPIPLPLAIDIATSAPPSTSGQCDIQIADLSAKRTILLDKLNETDNRVIKFDYAYVIGVLDNKINRNVKTREELISELETENQQKFLEMLGGDVAIVRIWSYPKFHIEICGNTYEAPLSNRILIPCGTMNIIANSGKLRKTFNVTLKKGSTTLRFMATSDDIKLVQEEK